MPKTSRRDFAHDVGDLGPSAIAELPGDGMIELTGLLRSCEARATVAAQALFTLLAAIPKDDGGERMVARLAMVARVHFRARRWRIAEWGQAEAGHWDNALAGSSALQP